MPNYYYFVCVCERENVANSYSKSLIWAYFGLPGIVFFVVFSSPEFISAPDLCIPLSP